MTNTIKAIIVDDEKHARDALERALACHENIEIIAQCSNGREAIAAVNESKPDLMFLDIQMPQLDGFNVLELLGDDTPHLIFVTAYDEFALKAFEKNAIDYLLKPLCPQRLETAIDKVARLIRGSEEPSSELKQLGDHKPGPIDKVLVRDGGEVTIIPANEISYIETAGDYVGIHQFNDEQASTHIKQSTLQELANRLCPQKFCRIHRSYLININYLEQVCSDDLNKKTAKLRTGELLSISRSGLQNLKRSLSLQQ